MAFRLGSPGASGFGSASGALSNAQTQTGSDLEEIQTEALGFQSIAGDSKVRLLPSPWSSDALPPPTASLLSIASKKGLLAAGGPDSVIIGSTDSVRQAFSATGEAGNDIKPFVPQLTLPAGTRISQVAFSADENYLVISPEAGGGLAVYDVQSLMQGSTQPAFQLPTNGASLRAVIANPAPAMAELFAVVTTNGQLMIANLKTQDFLNGPQGQIMKDGVSCVSWSTKGKQLVIGLADGTAFRMTPEGEGKGTIPRPPGLEGVLYVSSIYWLENTVFLIAHTQSSYDAGSIPQTVFHIVTQHPPSSFVYQKLPDPCPPFGLDRSPPHHFIQRLRGFPPSLQDLLIVASTVSVDIGMFSRSQVALVSDIAADKITDVFTTTAIANDARRAQLPMTEDLVDSSAIGVALDLSSKDKVERPLPGEEMDESPSPLPALMTLNNEGILSSWWIVYAESIRQGTAYPGLVAAAGLQVQAQPQAAPQVSPFASSNQHSAPAFGQTPFGGQSSGLSTFGKPSGAPAFGQASTSSSLLGGAFGAPSGIGKQPSPWGASSAASTTAHTGATAFGQTAFGSPSVIGGSHQGTAFGTTGGIGNRASPWATASSGTTGSTFGQAGGLGMRTGPSFGNATSGPTFNSDLSAGAPAGSGGGFASFAKAPGFAAAAAQGDGESIFAKGASGTSFSSGMDTDSVFGGTSRKKEEIQGSIFMSGNNFTLCSGFRGDGSAEKDTAKPASTNGNSFFGGTFGSVLGEVQDDAPQTTEADMDEDDSENDQAGGSPVSSIERDSMTPITTPAAPKFQFPQNAPPTTGGLFGTQSQSKFTPAAVQRSVPATFSPPPGHSSTPPISSFGKPSVFTTTPKDTPRKPDALASPVIKPEPEDDENVASRGINKNIPEAPLPPDSTSKNSYAAGDSSSTSTPVNDAPLPPDFLPSKGKPKGLDEEPEVKAALPTDDEGEGLDDEGSGVDVAQELSPTTDPNQSPKITPGSSFGGPFDRSPVGGLFSKVAHPQPQQTSKSLFGEVGKTSVPFFPPPSKVQESPRSPSPVRLPIPGDMLQPGKAKGVSASESKPKSSGSGRLGLSVRQTSPEDRRKKERDRLAAQQARKDAEEEQDLSDREDEKVREELATEVEPTKTLEPFLAHQDYVGNIDKPGIPGQIEKVYRDINSMIDTLGLNARSLQAFTKGHTELFQEGERSREDLEKGDDWCLFEIADLSVVESKLSEELEDGRIQAVQEKLDRCRVLQKDLVKIRAKHNDTKRFVDAKTDPEQIEARRTAPLNVKQASLQRDLRKDFTGFQKLLSETEQGISMLKAKLASHDASVGNNGAHKGPTVEAITKTIMKMTSMVEKKSGDIDVLETQMRKLRFSSTGISNENSREGSPASLIGDTPTSKRLLQSATRTPLQSLKITTPFYTPESERGGSLRNSVGAETAASPRKRMSAISEDEVRQFRTKGRRRKDVNSLLKQALLKTGPRVRGLDEV